MIGRRLHRETGNLKGPCEKRKGCIMTIRAIDMFSGWGGFTEGAGRAGVDVVWAGNHWPLAVEAHAANHPETIHVCQDLQQADWTKVPDYDLLLASPACQGHSQAAQPGRARSDRTRRFHDAYRATAHAVIHCADVTNPKAIIVENVLDFYRWTLFPGWKYNLELLGYDLHALKLRASHFGVPQRRDRAFVVAVKSGTSINLDFEALPEPGFGPSIQWDKGEWRSIRENPFPAARRRLTTASGRFGRGIVQHVSHHRGLGLHEPIRTITTKDQWAVVDGARYRPLTVRENARGMGFPDSYRWPDRAGRGECIRGLGNAVCPPVATALVQRVCQEVM
jgi:DNA (cytosine-5)-methyltransferase 1